jgi:hypothetical protein
MSFAGDALSSALLKFFSTALFIVYPVVFPFNYVWWPGRVLAFAERND